jgi:hypothetical protein
VTAIQSPASMPTVCPERISTRRRGRWAAGPGGGLERQGEGDDEVDLVRGVLVVPADQGAALAGPGAGVADMRGEELVAVVGQGAGGDGDVQPLQGRGHRDGAVRGPRVHAPPEVGVQRPAGEWQYCGSTGNPVRPAGTR